MGEKRKVLVLDDDLLQFMEVEEVLEGRNYEVARLSTPSGAFSKIDFEEPDALLVDITMDRLDADDLIETLRNSPDHRGVIIVVYSEMDSGTLEGYCEEHDVNGYFRKSMQIARLPEFLANFFD